MKFSHILVFINSILAFGSYAQKADSIMISNFNVVKQLIEAKAKDEVLLLIIKESSELVPDSQTDYSLFYLNQAIAGLKNVNQKKLKDFQIKEIENFINKSADTSFYQDKCDEKYLQYRKGVCVLLLNKGKSYFFILRGCPLSFADESKRNTSINAYLNLLLYF